MARIEIDEAEYMAQRSVIEAVNGMMANPSTRRKVLEARKEAFPGAVIPELDAAKPIQDDVSKLREELAAQKAERAAEKAEAAQERVTSAFASKWNAKKDAIRAEGYNEEYISKVEELAHERGIPDLDAAQALFDRLNPPPAVSAPGDSGWNFFADNKHDGDDYIKRLMDAKGDDDRLVTAEAGRTLQDLRAQTARR